MEWMVDNADAKKKRRKRLYNMHYAVRKQGFSLSSKSRTVYHPYNEEVKMSASLTRLIREHGYQIQLEIV